MILDMVHKLQEITDSISQSMEEMQTGATKINETGAALTDISAKVKDSLREIGNEVDLFKV